MTYWLSSYFLWLIRMATTLANTWCTPPRATSWSSPTATLLALNPAWASSSSHLTRVFAISQNWFDTKSKGPFDQSLQQVVQYRIRLSPFDYNIKRSIFFFISIPRSFNTIILTNIWSIIAKTLPNRWYIFRIYYSFECNYFVIIINLKNWKM